MSTAKNGYLNANSELSFRDWQHASRLYVEGDYRLAPKPKWLYYAVFNINPEAIPPGTAFRAQNQQELNYLAKKMDLPRYTLNVENLNQYNRKTTSYTRITYDPVTITFHDDNAQTTNGLWALYYGYYFADRLNSSPQDDINPAAYRLHAYDEKTQFPYAYGLDNGQREPFFRSIQLITLSKNRFTSYLLCHPKITSWQHDTMDQSDGSGVIENTMTLAYDAVIYNSGQVDFDNPSTFGTLHYDNFESPLNNPTYALDAEQAFADSAAFFGDSQPSSPFNSLLDAALYTALSVAQNPEFIGIQQAYGYNSTNFRTLRTPNAISTTSGLQNYSFGNYNSPTGMSNVLDNTIDQGFIEGTKYPLQTPPIDEDYLLSTARKQKEQGINEEYSGFARSKVPNAPSITDAYVTSLPKTSKSSTESKIFNNYNTGRTLDEGPTGITINYFIDGDYTKNVYTSRELVANDPQRKNKKKTDPFK